MTREPVRVAVLGLPEGSASASLGILDTLAAAGRGWNALHGRPPGPPVFDARLLSLDGEPYADLNGRHLRPDGRLDDGPPPEVVIVPDLLISPFAPPPNGFAPLAKWLRDAHAQGTTVCSVCSGAMLLGETGLLDGEDATTHWGYFEAFARRFPQARLRRERILVPAGEGHRVVTAGGASAWGDLVLYLIARYAGPEEASRIARVFLIQPHADGQLHYASLLAGRQHEDALVAEMQAWAALHYPEPNPVAAMAQRFGLTERSLHRRFRRATGQSPLDYVQTLRIEEAKQMLETTDLPIEEVAAEVGYAEGSSFRALFRRKVGMTAAAYRRRRLPRVA